MSMVVQHNLTAMNANRMLGMTTKSQAKSTEKLSSGYRINRAADDAAGLSISEKMRKQIRGLTQASTNAQDGISAVQTAEGALTEVHDMLQRMNELAVQAANGTNSEDDRQYIQDEIDQLITEIDRVAETTKFNEAYLLKGDYTGTSKEYTYFESNVKLTEVGNPTATVALYDACGNTVSARVAVDMMDNGDTIYKSVSQGTAAAASDLEGVSVANIDLYDATGHCIAKAGDILDSGVIASVNAGKVYASASGISGATVSGSDMTKATVASTTIYNADGSVRYAEDTIVTKEDCTSIASFYSTAATREKAVEGEDYQVVEYGKLYDKDGNGIAENGLYNYFKKNNDGELVYKGGLYDNNGAAIGVAGKTLNDSDNEELSKNLKITDTGTPALKLKLHVGADATQNNQIQLEINAMDATTLGIKDVSVSGTDDSNALDAIETIKAAIQKVSEQRSALGAVQNRLEHTISNLDNVVENTTSAESQIRDTDMATEMVNYSKTNILAQAGQAMLAQANQSNQGVLSLLG